MKRFYIGGLDNPYMIRWYVLPRNHWFNVYLHKFCRDDDDRALHCHPWWFISLVLHGGYIEHRTGMIAKIRRSFSVAFRRATTQHRIELFRDDEGAVIPCWTLVITGRKKRTWGFWCPKGFVPWYDFVDHTDQGNTGKGCE